jgi:hypothetical protein
MKISPYIIYLEMQTKCTTNLTEFYYLQKVGVTETNLGLVYKNMHVMKCNLSNYLKFPIAI